MTHAAIVQIFHEANAFAPQMTRYEDFLSGRFHRGDAARAALLASRNWVAGVAAGLEAQGHEVHFGLCATARPGGILDRTGFDRVKREMLESLAEISQHHALDCVVLLLHGALSVEGHAAPETEIARAVRALIGPDVPLLVPLDFHANVEPGLMATADRVIGGKLYPHTDTFERGARLVELSRAGPGLTSHCFRLPIVSSVSAQSTDLAHMAAMVALSEDLQRRDGVADVGLMGGFPYADNDVVGMSVLVTGSDREAMAGAFREMADRVWENRTAFLEVPPTFSAIAGEVMAAAQAGRVVVADIGDNPGSGGLANQAGIIRALVAQPLPFVAGFVVDGAAVAAAAAVGVGRRGSIPLGRLADGAPLFLDAVVERVGEVRYRNEAANMQGELMLGGRGAVLRVGPDGQGHICVVTERLQAFDTMAFRSQGIDIEAKSIIYLKSANHFRTAFGPLATGGTFFVDEGGCASTNMHHFAFTRRARDILPLTEIGHDQWQRFVDAECAAALARSS